MFILLGYIVHLSITENAMEECKSTQNTSSQNAQQEICDSTKFLSSCSQSLQEILKKVFTFICYGPGVLGFLWLIGRILKR